MRDGAARNLVPQQCGFSPGTSMIGNFGATDARFRRIPMSGEPEYSNPGPGAYNPLSRGLQPRPDQASSARWSIKGEGHALSYAATPSPGPGAYGEEQHPLGGILTGLQRSWPGITSMSGFGTNSALPTLQKVKGDGQPGPGHYDYEESTRFTSNAIMSRSPFVGDARARTGSRLQRDMDGKLSAVFASTRPAHKLPAPGDESGAATDPKQDGPGPGAHEQKAMTIESTMAGRHRAWSLRADGGAGSSFNTTAQRFGKRADDHMPDPLNPGPGSHTLKRWSGEPHTSFRRPRRPARSTGFLSSAQRFEGGGRQAIDPDELMYYLAHGGLGPVGSPAHAIAALQKARSSAAV